jgi:hypothetical protein
MLEGLRREPGLDDHEAARPGVPAHVPDGDPEPAHGSNVADRAEQADHDVVGRAQIELGHVRVVKRDRGQLSLRLLQQRRIQIEAFDLEDRAQMQEVAARAAADVQQPSG